MEEGKEPHIFQGHWDMYDTFNHLRDDVKWIESADDRKELHEMLDFFMRAADIHKTSRKLKAEDYNIPWKALVLESHLWYKIRNILKDKGYDRRWFIHKDGKVGLNTKGPVQPAIKPIYDEVIITYDHCEQMLMPIPVRLGDKCALITPDGMNHLVCDFVYDFIFREPWSNHSNYIARKNGKWGIMKCDGTLIVPCEMDYIYERGGRDGIVILEKDGKYGFYNDLAYCIPEYEADDIQVYCDEMVRVRKNGQWGWIDSNGQFTLNEKEAGFSNFDDDDK